MVKDNASPRSAPRRGRAAAGERAAAAESGYAIGDLAREFGVTLRTLRFYEVRGLFAPKRIGMHRLYSERDRERLALILKAKQLGFTLVEIRAMLAKEEAGPAAPAQQADAIGRLNLGREKIVEQLELLRTQRDQIEAAIAELEASLKAMG